MLRIMNLVKSFNDKRVLDNLSIEIEDGSVFGLIGINGAGGFPSGDAGNHQQDAGELSGAGSIAIVAVRQIF